jgi:hypothetical protein
MTKIRLPVRQSGLRRTRTGRAYGISHRFAAERLPSREDIDKRAIFFKGLIKMLNE